MKTGKELKITTLKKYNVSFGSVNNKQPKAMYITISSWATPKDEYTVNFNRIIRDLTKKVKQSIFNLFDAKYNEEFNKDRSIIDLDIRESGIRFGKRSFINCELTLFLNNEIPIQSDEMTPMLNDIINTITNIFETNKSFDFYKRKK